MLNVPSLQKILDLLFPLKAPKLEVNRSSKIWIFLVTNKSPVCRASVLRSILLPMLGFIYSTCPIPIFSSLWTPVSLTPSYSHLYVQVHKPFLNLHLHTLHPFSIGKTHESTACAHCVHPFPSHVLPPLTKFTKSLQPPYYQKGF